MAFASAGFTSDQPATTGQVRLGAAPGQDAPDRPLPSSASPGSLSSRNAKALHKEAWRHMHTPTAEQQRWCASILRDTATMGCPTTPTLSAFHQEVWPFRCPRR